MVNLAHISKSFSGHRVVDDVSFTIPENEITIIAGADGAGKSTIFKIILGLVARDDGIIRLGGRKIAEDFGSITRISGYMPERFSLYPDLTVEENLNFFADIHRIGRAERERMKQRLLTTTGMAPFSKRRARDLSGGMKQKLALSTILLSAPSLVFLDEPTTGVDPLSRIEFFSIIDDLKTEGKTIVISTPYLDEAEKGDRIIMIRSGRVIQADRINRLKERFPARIVSIAPRDDAYRLLMNLREDSRFAGRVYLRGNRLKVVTRSGDSSWRSIPSLDTEVVPPTLEDIYLYYQKTADGNAEAL